MEIIFLPLGYYNTNGNNAYLQIAQMFAKYGVTFDFTCLEMTDSPTCASSPEVPTAYIIL